MKLVCKLMLIIMVTQLSSCVIVINHAKGSGNRLKDSTFAFKKEAFPTKDFYRDAQRRRELKRYGRKDN